MPDGARWKNCWFRLASWTRSLKETWRKLARLYQTVSEFYFDYKKRQNLVLSGSIWPASFNFPSNFWSRKPDRTSNFLSGSVWHDFVWLSGPWCSQGIKKKGQGKDATVLHWIGRRTTYEYHLHHQRRSSFTTKDCPIDRSFYFYFHCQIWWLQLKLFSLKKCIHRHKMDVVTGEFKDLSSCHHLTLSRDGRKALLCGKRTDGLVSGSTYLLTSICPVLFLPAGLV